MEPVFVVHHARSGVIGLNVVTAALSGDGRTADVEVVFAAGVPQLIEGLRAAAARGARPVAGWSFFSPGFAAACDDLTMVREATAGMGVLHLAGGVHASAEPGPTLRAGFDLVAIGEGESTAVELFAALRSGRAPGELRALPGLAWIDESGRVASSGPGARRPLDDFPAFNARAGKWNAIEITRGCPYACSFCQTPFMFKARLRHRSVANVRLHVAQMRREGGRYVRFLSPTSLSYGAEGPEPDLAAVEALLAGVREEIGPEGKVYFGTFPSEVRPEHVTPEALRILGRRVDNRVLAIGAQSGSERVLAKTHRGHGVPEVERAVRLCLEAGFVPCVDFLLGLPGEEPEDREASIALARRLVDRGARIRSHAFLPLPGTPLAGAAPAPIEAGAEAAMARLESEGALRGQWRKQRSIAQQLVSQRKGG